MDSSLSNDDFVPLLESNGYEVKTFLGSGTFGRVYFCKRSDTAEAVAVKAIPKENAEFGKEELHNLERLRELDPDKNNLIKFNGHFEFQGNLFLEFEKLDMTLLEFTICYSRALRLSEIQVITRQLLVALDALKSIKMIHGDIKIDNIMLDYHGLQACKVKLIDFGGAQNVSKLGLGDILQVLPYRAPEVILGLPLSEAVDMWSLGAVISTGYLEDELCSGNCELANINDIMQLFGQPDDDLLNSGIHTEKYFFKDEDLSWKLKTECQCSTYYISGNSESLKSDEECAVHPLVTDITSHRFASLRDIVKTRPGTAMYEDTQAFISLLKEIMQVDPEKRTTPAEALMHPFFFMKHFPSDSAAFNNEELPPATSLANRTVAAIDDRPSQRISLDNTSVIDTSPASATDFHEDKINIGDGIMGLKVETKINHFKGTSDIYGDRTSTSSKKPPQKPSSEDTDVAETSDTSVIHVFDRDKMNTNDGATGSEVKIKARAKQEQNKNKRPEQPTTAYDSSKELPQEPSSEDTNVAETLPATAGHVSAGVKNKTNDGTTGYVVKIKMIFKGICECVSQLFKRTASTNMLAEKNRAISPDRPASDSTQKPPREPSSEDTNMAETSPATASHVSAGVKNKTNDRTTGSVVKIKMIFKGICEFVWQLFKRTASANMLAENTRAISPDRTASDSSNQPPQLR
ncbi:homeodomain-interacting protein kinase 2-like [Solea senegalensis]|uniref:Homeodomain-interacting protein kinase 2-like n=1 Tax=Solea senegalensis TaxID=28829 RepID=A0AAV6PS11_SOLSE|nr:homeodomain-interacting protein kinase 2-like [Solea senegalensis]